MHVNVRASLHLISLALPFLKRKPDFKETTSITVLTSTAGHTPDPASVLMSTTHAMLQMLVKCTALEASYFKVRCNAVAAGVTYGKTRS